jgi:hypothetical protein
MLRGPFGEWNSRAKLGHFLVTARLAKKVIDRRRTT